MKYVKLFNEIRLSESNIFGGKVAALAEMSHGALPIPDGFGISIEAHREFSTSPFSREFIDQLRDAFAQIGAVRVAVRSSAVAEDGADASWAGQLESYLNVTEESLEESIRKCWQSVAADHVSDYASDKDLDEDSLLVGVAVQTMVDSEVAGVMFTINPVTKDSNDLIIEGSYGLGETVVQGIVTPDNFHYDKRQSVVTEYNIQIKNEMMVYQDGKNITIPVPEHKADRAIFRTEQVERLAELGLVIEKYFGKPQDIEWAYNNGRLYIVQARPITTLV